MNKLPLALLLVPGLSAAASFTPLDAPMTAATSISADGSTVVGLGDGASATEAFRWIRGKTTGLGDLALPAYYSFALGVSSDGTVVVGQGSSTAGDEAFRWTDGGIAGLGDLDGGGFLSRAYGVSADGSVVVGLAFGSSGGEAFRWTNGQMTGLGDLAGGSFQSYASDISAAGDVIVGTGRSASGDEAFRWTDGTLTGLGDLDGGQFQSLAYGVSGDGLVVVGVSSSALGAEAFRWTAAGGMKGLGNLVGDVSYSEARAASFSGDVVVGQASGMANSLESVAIVWTEAGGMQRLIDVLQAGGVAGLDGWILFEAVDVSADGQWITGNATDPLGHLVPYLANISPEPPDTLPDSFGFSDESDAPSGTVVTSNVVTVAGIDLVVPISVVGGEYSIGCGSLFTDVPGRIFAGQQVCVRHRSADTASTATHTTLVIGGVMATFTSITTPRGGSGGGGALDGPTLLGFGLLAWVARRSRRPGS